MNQFIDEVKRLREIYTEIYIYGAGVYGRNVYKILAENETDIAGFLQTRCEEEQSFVCNKPIFEAVEIVKKQVGIIVSLNSHNSHEVEKYLEQMGVEASRIIYANKYLENGGTRYTEEPTMEITTVIGCKVECKYCPQKALLKSYFNEDKTRKAIMDMETFEICLSKLPQNCTVVFSGMAEPFLNVDCLSMIKITLQSHRRVHLYTTLVGANMGIVRELCALPVQFVTLHVADQFQYAKIPTTDEYYEMVEYMLNAVKKDGTPFVNMCNAQGTPDKRVQELCEGKYVISTILMDKSGEAGEEGLIQNKGLKGNIRCSISVNNTLNDNILLPDGTIVLCPIDYSMKHILGNLLKEEYEDIINGKNMKLIQQGLYDENINILCRKCPMAYGI